MLGLAFYRAQVRATPHSPEHSEAFAGFLLVNTVHDALQTGAYDKELFAAAWRHAGLGPSRVIGRAMRLALDAIECPPIVPGPIALYHMAAGAAEWRKIVGGRLMELGAALRKENRLEYAVCIYELVSRRVYDPDLHMRALRDRGCVLRDLRDFPNAEFVYDCLASFARYYRANAMELSASLGHARIAGQSGDLDHLAAEAGRIRDAAREIGDRELEANACLDLSYVAGKQTDWKAVIVHCNAALQCHLSPADDERCLVNMAFAYWQLARRAVAGRCYEAAVRIGAFIAANAAYEHHRNEVALMFYDMAIARRDTVSLRYYRGRLLKADLTPDQRQDFATYRQQETLLPYTPPSALADVPSQPADDDADLVSIADRITDHIGVASVA